MKSFRQYLIEHRKDFHPGKLNARWSAWLSSLNTEHPNPRVEPGTEEIAASKTQRESAKKPKKKPKKKTETLKTELGTGFTIDSPLHPSKAANTESATQTPDGSIISYHNELLTHTALDGVTKKDRMVPLTVRSEPLMGDRGYKTEVTIYTSKDGRPIHRYIHDEENEGLIGEPVEHFADVNDEENEEIPGHTSYPQSQLTITHRSAKNIITDHLNNIIRNGKSKGLSVAEHHGIDLDW